MSVIRTILHPTDFSESAEAAFAVACGLAREHHARIVVLHVCSKPVCQAEIDICRHGQTSDAELYHLLQKYEAREIEVEHRLIEGEAAKEILHQATETGCDVIVMGTQGRSGLARMLLGVAQKVMHSAGYPVLTVHLPEAERATGAREASQSQ